MTSMKDKYTKGSGGSRKINTKTKAGKKQAKKPIGQKKTYK